MKSHNYENKKLTYDSGKLPEIICAAHPDWCNIYMEAWKTAFENVEYPQHKGWLPQLSCAPGSGNIWQWDSCLMGLFARYSNSSLPAMNNLDNLYRLQRRDGYISMTYVTKTEKPAYGERINPPLYAWVEWEYYALTGDDSRFCRVLPILVAYYDWMKKNRTRKNGLYWFEDTGSSGMDNSPRSGYAAKDLAGSDICFIDLACQQALSAIYIRKMAAHLSKRKLASRFANEHAKLKKLINKLHWSERHKFYYDLFDSSNPQRPPNFLSVKTIASFWPILAEIADEEQVKQLMEHLVNPEEFGTLHPVPSLSRDAANYDPLGGYWLGSVWAPTNYMVVQGLERHGKSQLAREISIKHLNAMVQVMKDKAYGNIWECYSPELMRPATRCHGDKLVRKRFVGWSGLGPISMLIESIFGLSFDAGTNQISWDIRTAGVHGIKNLQFNRGTVSLVCEDDILNKGKGKVMIETSRPVNLKISATGTGKCIRKALKAGCHCLNFDSAIPKLTIISSAKKELI